MNRIVRSELFADDILTVEMVVSLDATDEDGPITSYGSRPKRIVNFFQTEQPWWADMAAVNFGVGDFQRGAPIEGADVEHDLTNCVGHTDLDSALIVRSVTLDALKEMVQVVRHDVRYG